MNAASPDAWTHLDYQSALWDTHAAALDLSGKRLFITGATGLIGSAVLALLAHLWRSGRGPQVLALSRDPQAFLSRRREFRDLPWLEWLEADIADYAYPPESFDYLVHGAHILPPGGAANPLAIYDATVAASRRVLEHAVAAAGGRVLLVSTGGVSGRNEPVSYPIAEPRGEVDWLRTNAAYCEAKRASEMFAGLFRAAQGVDVVIARPFSIVGPGLSLEGNYALGNFIRDALWGEEISIQSDGTAVRSYLYIADLAVWLLRILVAGQAGRTYNIGSDQAVDLRQLAEFVSREVGGGKAVRVYGLAATGPARPDRVQYVPDVTRAREELGLGVWTDLATAIRLTARAARDSAPQQLGRPAEGTANNPHFDEGRVIWKDEYAGRYPPVAYSEQFDDQWRLYLEGREGFREHTGVETSDPYIDERIYELTGVPGYLAGNRSVGTPAAAHQELHIGGRLFLEPHLPVDFFQGKRCLDIGCGAGRWTRTLQALGGRVKSVDVSTHALQSTRRFNDDVEFLDLFGIAGDRPDLHGAFDFVLCWGVIMCTHDPLLAFANVARTVRPGGHLYVMVYAPTYHNSEFVRSARRKYHRQLTTLDERLEYAYALADDPRNTINLLDMLNTFYNWTIPEETVHGWFTQHGFTEVRTLNAREQHKCAYHVFGRLSAQGEGSGATP